MYTYQFKPTWLYIKQHKVTKMLYLGKTTAKDPHRYMGSGRYWKNHIKAHGKEYVVTLWCQLFNDESSLISAALELSRCFNVVQSSQWANLKEENGVDGGGTYSDESRNLMREARLRDGVTPPSRKGIPRSEEAKRKTSETLKGKNKYPKTEEHKQKLREASIRNGSRPPARKA